MPPPPNIQSELGPSTALQMRRRKGNRTYGARPQRAEWRVPSLPIDSPRSWNKDLGRVPARHPECDIDSEQLIEKRGLGSFLRPHGSEMRRRHEAHQETSLSTGGGGGLGSPFQTGRASIASRGDVLVTNLPSAGRRSIPVRSPRGPGAVRRADAGPCGRGRLDRTSIPRSDRHSVRPDLLADPWCARERGSKAIHVKTCIHTPAPRTAGTPAFAHLPCLIT